MKRTLLVSIDSFHQKKKKRLQEVIERKKIRLASLTERYETLKNELDLVQREYAIRIGSLYARDNKLDLEIIKFKNILSLLKQGFSFEEIMKRLKNSFFHQAYSKANEECIDMAQMHKENFGKSSKEDVVLLKKLFRELLMTFHPDLVTEPGEKMKREQIMKKINMAYAQKDYNALEDIKHMHYITTVQDRTVEDLEKLIIKLENMIISVKKQTNRIKKTEWFSWYKMIQSFRKLGKDAFKEHEDELLADVLKKAAILSRLKQQVLTINRRFDF